LAWPALYYFLHSPFLALMELLIYIGAVCVTIIFAIMLASLTNRQRRETWRNRPLGRRRVGRRRRHLLGPLLPSAHTPTGSPRIPNQRRLHQAIGVSLLTTYSLAFELISLALLVAILGALAIARAGRRKS